MHFQHDEEKFGHHRARRNVFYDMLEDFTDTVNGYGSDEDDDEEEEDEIVAKPIRVASSASDSDSVESTTTRFGRFISPLAFNKISETLGELQKLRLELSFNKLFQEYLVKAHPD